jgi:hypothetical protein
MRKAEPPVEARCVCGHREKRHFGGFPDRKPCIDCKTCRTFRPETPFLRGDAEPTYRQ